MDPRTTSPRRVGRLTRGLRETGRLHWRVLSPGGRVSVAGVVASALLALALGVLIPRMVERHALGARLDAVSSLVQVLEREHLVPAIGDDLASPAYEQFDGVVRGGLLGGENVRVKLWNLSGEVVYSDESRLVGQRFPLGAALASALAGRPSAVVSNLSAAENRFDRHLGHRLLEFYIPLQNQQGAVVGAFEVYQDFGPLAAHLAALQRVVWIAVGTGLSILLVFLVSLFTATAKAMAGERRAAEERAGDLATLLETSHALSSEPTIERTGPDVLSILVESLGLRCAGLLLDGDQSQLAVVPAGEARVCRLATSAARRAHQRSLDVATIGSGEPALGHAAGGGSCSVLAVPFHAGPDLRGTLVACREPEHAFGSRERLLLSAVAAQLGVAAESATLVGDLQQMTEARGRLLRRLVSAQEEERRHLVGDLHDGLGQTLTRILHGLRGSRARLSPEASEVDSELARLESLVDEQARDLRRHIAAIRPEVLEDFGLPQALEAFAREQETETGIQIDVRAERLDQLDPAVAITLFRAAQEAVINARKHAEARRLWIRLEQHEGVIVLEVRDDGRGAAQLRDGIGLTYMKDRAASLGGHVDVRTRLGEGTTVRVRVPVEVERGEHSNPRG